VCASNANKKTNNTNSLTHENAQLFYTHAMHKESRTVHTSSYRAKRCNYTHSFKSMSNPCASSSPGGGRTSVTQTCPTCGDIISRPGGGRTCPTCRDSISRPGGGRTCPTCRDSISRPGGERTPTSGAIGCCRIHGRRIGSFRPP